MDNEVKISIIIPNFNRGDLLGETLDSILGQSYQNWEAIVVDDGSDDNSDEVGDEYKARDSRIKYIKRKTINQGAPVCRNIGFGKSTGNYIIFLDSDDLLADFCLEKRAEIINLNPELDFVVFPMLMFTNDIGTADIIWNVDNNKSDYYRFLSLDAVWQTSGPIWKREAVEQIGGFTEGLACWQDVDFHLKAFENELIYDKFYHLKPDCYYRRHEAGSISQGEISSLPKLKARFEILADHYINLKKPVSENLSAIKIMAANIVFGAAKTLHFEITNELINYCVKNNLITADMGKKARRIQFYMKSRLNRFKYFNNKIKTIVEPYKTDSEIGRHKYIDKA